MKIIEPKVETWGYCPDNNDEALKWIEKATRICYNSQDKICEGSHIKLLKNKVVPSGHTAMMEHSWKSIELDHQFSTKHHNRTLLNVPVEFLNNTFLKVDVYKNKIYIVGNYRAWVEFLIRDGKSADYLNSQPNLHTFDIYKNIEFFIRNEIAEYGGFSCKFVPNEELPIYLRPITCHFKVSRAVTHELVRHRPFTAFAQLSQRYVASRSDVEFIRPVWVSENIREPNVLIRDVDDASLQWAYSMANIETAYHKLLKIKTPQEAREVLPNSTATEITVTAPVFQWDWIDHLRTAKDAFPPMVQAMTESKKQRNILLGR